MSSMETGACSCSYDYGEGCELYFEKTYKARKAWRCIECGEDIRPGQQYISSRYVFEGRWSKYETCVPCARIRVDYYAKCGSWVAGVLREDILECWGFDYVTGDDDSEEEETDAKILDDPAVPVDRRLR